LTVKTVEHVCIGFPKDTTILIDLNRLDANSDPSIEVYNQSGWQYPLPLHISIQHEDRQHNIIVRLTGGGQNNYVVNK